MTFKQLAKEAFKEFQVGDRVILKNLPTLYTPQLEPSRTLAVITYVSFRDVWKYRIEIRQGIVAWMHKEDLELYID